MSTRHMRKLLGSTALPPPDENSDDDFVPLYTKKKAAKGAYAALELDSTPDPEPDSENKIIEDEQPESSNQEKKKKRNNRKNKKAKSTNALDMDEIDKSIREVNALLGEPTPFMESQKNKPDPEALLFSVQQKHLDSNNEMTRLFGPEDDEDEIRRQRQRNIKFQKNIVIPKVYAFNKLGISMSVKSRNNDVTYFSFDHNKEYRDFHQTFLNTIRRLRAAGVMAPIEDLLSIMHIEGLLESADMCFRMEEYTSANEIIEQSIAYMQYVAHPCFSLTGRRSRLEYKYLENRPFHILLLKYLHLLTNRACHRTALELAKVLLNLDPGDPLAVVLVVDTLALRAREHAWLRAAVGHWDAERDGRFMFNLQYSRAMCCFHLAKARNEESNIEEANTLLQNTLLKFPYVLIKLLECCNHSVPEKIRKSYFFNEFASVSTSQPLKDLMWLYIKLSWARWREPAVLDWLLSNANTVVDNFDTNVMNQTTAMKEVQKHSLLFQKWPEEVIRHLCIIKPMADLLVDGAVPEVPSYALSSNPCPPANTVNRYNYVLQRQGNMDFVPALLRTIQPYFNDDEQN